MTNCTLFLLGEKGYTSLINIPPALLGMIQHVVIGEDKNILYDYSKEIKEYSVKHNIPFSYRTKYNGKLSDYNFAIGWRWMIDLKQGNYLITFHDSILPKYRGFNPLVTALINGDAEVGVTALCAADKADAGAIIEIKKLQVKYPAKIKKIISDISVCYSELLNSILKKIFDGTKPAAYTQDESLATFSLWRDEEDYFINWNDDAVKIKRMIDATGDPYLGARTTVEEEVMIIHEAEVMKDINIINRTPGKVIMKQGNNPVVVCGTGLLQIVEASKTDGIPFQLKSLRTRFK